MYYLNNYIDMSREYTFLRTKFICIIWTLINSMSHGLRFLRTKFICIIWTLLQTWLKVEQFLRTKFICIIWTKTCHIKYWVCSWGLSLFVLFEQLKVSYRKLKGSWGLSLFVLFEPSKSNKKGLVVLED